MNDGTYNYTRDIKGDESGTGTSAETYRTTAEHWSDHIERVTKARRNLASSSRTKFAGTTSSILIKSGVETVNFHDTVWEILDEAGNLLIRKHKDYGPLNISRSPGGPINGLRVRMWDKMARINNLVDNGATPENESLRDSFIDLLNYAAIAIMVLEDRWPKE